MTFPSTINASERPRTLSPKPFEAPNQAPNQDPNQDPNQEPNQNLSPEPTLERIPTLRLVRCEEEAIAKSTPGGSPIGRPLTGLHSPRGRKVRELFDRYHHRVEMFLHRLTTGEQAEDIAQEVFFRLLKVRNLERREISVGYLFRIGENLVRKRYHRDQRHRKATEELKHRCEAIPGTDLGDFGAIAGSVASSEMTPMPCEELHLAMVHLTDNEQAAIRLIICRGLSYEQAARSLGVNVSTINNWKHRGVNKLRRIIDEKRSDSHRQDPGGGRDPA